MVFARFTVSMRHDSAPSQGVRMASPLPKVSAAMMRQGAEEGTGERRLQGWLQHSPHSHQSQSSLGMCPFQDSGRFPFISPWWAHVGAREAFKVFSGGNKTLKPGNPRLELHGEGSRGESRFQRLVSIHQLGTLGPLVRSARFLAIC